MITKYANNLPGNYNGPDVLSTHDYSNGQEHSYHSPSYRPAVTNKGPSSRHAFANQGLSFRQGFTNQSSLSSTAVTNQQPLSSSTVTDQQINTSVTPVHQCTWQEVNQRMHFQPITKQELLSEIRKGNTKASLANKALNLLNSTISGDLRTARLEGSGGMKKCHGTTPSQALNNNKIIQELIKGISLERLYGVYPVTQDKALIMDRSLARKKISEMISQQKKPSAYQTRPAVIHNGGNIPLQNQRNIARPTHQNNTNRNLPRQLGLSRYKPLA
ncbi:uncharacterized protein LOC110231420 isoform X2 [Exaiptasia diaphana]|uniref:Uncharacterized protein n=1 Tax=Exaiptasia diaphana TaxID=2652724 RepID=A0A913WPG5_EXADI|nr:uncharacterized protein LOC110231420 isoform X2 [Exaiptasia diaphana]